MFDDIRQELLELAMQQLSIKYNCTNITALNNVIHFYCDGLHFKMRGPKFSMVKSDAFSIVESLTEKEGKE